MNIKNGLAVIVAIAATAIFALPVMAFAETIPTADTVSGAAKISHSTTSLTVDTIAPKEGGKILVDFRWSLSSLLGEPILKCDAAWTLEGVYVKKRPNASVEWIATKDLPPKVAAQVGIIDLDVGVRIPVYKAFFTCDTGALSLAGNQRSFNLPTSPDWHELFAGYNALGKEQLIKNNKSIFKELIANRSSLPMLSQYEVTNIKFDLSAVREWLLEREEKALEKTEKELNTAKFGQKTEAKKVELEKNRAALNASKESIYSEQSSAKSAITQKRNEVENEGKRTDTKIAELKNKNIVAGTWRRENGLVILIPPTHEWENGGTAKILKRVDSFNKTNMEYKFKEIIQISDRKFSCQEYVTWNKGESFAWVPCEINIFNQNNFGSTVKDKEQREVLIKFTRIE